MMGDSSQEYSGYFTTDHTDRAPTSSRPLLDPRGTWYIRTIHNRVTAVLRPCPAFGRANRKSVWQSTSLSHCQVGFRAPMVHGISWLADFRSNGAD